MTHADLLQGAIRPQLTRMTLTLMVGMLTLMGFNLIDTFFVSRLGTLPLAAISFTFPVTVITSYSIHYTKLYENSGLLPNHPRLAPASIRAVE